MNGPGLHLPFPHAWSAQIRGTPPLIAPARQFTYPQRVHGEEDALGRSALFAEIAPASGPNFLATCALGFNEPSLPTGVWSCPAPNDLLAIAGGYGYLIDTLDPARCTFLDPRPICSVLPAREHGLLLLAGFHTVVAIGAHGVLWKTSRLSWEGISLGEVRDGHLHGLGWDMITDREIPFTVDLLTGAHQGGGYAGKG